MKRAIVVLGILVSLSVVGQQVNYSVVEDAPRYTDLSIMPNVMCDVGGDALGMGLGIEVDYRKKNLPFHIRAQAQKDFMVGWLNGITSNLHSGVQSSISNVELGLALPFSTSTSKTSLPVTLESNLVSSSSTSETYNVTFVNVEGSIEKMKMIRGGLYARRGNWISSDFDNFKLQGFDYIAVQGDFMAKGIYGGISIMNRRNLKIKADDYGECNETRHIEFYADFLFTPLTSFGTFTDNGGTEHDMDTKSNLEASKMGLRGGVIWKNGNFNGHGWYFKLETGLRPSVKGKGAFFAGAFGYALNYK